MSYKDTWMVRDVFLKFDMSAYIHFIIVRHVRGSKCRYNSREDSTHRDLCAAGRVEG